MRKLKQPSEINIRCWIGLSRSFGFSVIFLCYYVVIASFVCVILCILCFCILFYIVGSCKCRVFGLVVQLLFWANKWWWGWFGTIFPPICLFRFISPSSIRSSLCFYQLVFFFLLSFHCSVELLNVVLPKTRTSVILPMFFLHFIPCCMCVCHMCIKIPTYLLNHSLAFYCACHIVFLCRFTTVIIHNSWVFCSRQSFSPGLHPPAA